MEISVCKLTHELLDDWLAYFDKDAFSDNDEWCGCYCMCYHWDRELEKKRAWNCDRDCAETYQPNRHCQLHCHGGLPV
mgnify:CR=1 FL=1